MTWQDELMEGEEVRWEARPAPRCFTFRHWRHSIFGVIFLTICTYWQVLGIEMAGTYEVPWLTFLPLPFLLAGFYFSIGHLLQARLEWSNVCYVITNRRLLIQRGLRKCAVQSMALEEMTYFALHSQGEELGTLHVHKGLDRQLTLHCIEHPKLAVTLLEEAILGKDTELPGSQE